MLSPPRRSSPFTVCLRTGAGLNELIQLAPLPAIQKHLLHLFLFHERGKGECWPSGLTLLTRSGLRSRQTLATHKNALRARGLLSWRRPGEQGNEHTCCLYRLHWEQLQALVASRLAASSCGKPTRAARAPRSPAAGRTAAVAAARAASSGASLPTALPSGDSTPGPEEAANSSRAVAEEPEMLLEQAVELPAIEPQATGSSSASGPGFDSRSLTDAVSEPGAEPPSAEASGLVVPELDEALEADDAEATPCSPVATFREPEPTPAPLSAVRPCEPNLADDAPDFQVSVMLVWSCWQQAYLLAYGRPYFPLPADKLSASSLASACRSAVLHHTASGASTPQRLALAEQFLHHVSAAFLRLPGRDGFLQRRGHPLGMLLHDLNALGTPWPRRAAAAAPATSPPREPAAPVKALEPQQTAARARDVLALLKQGPCSVRPGSRR